MTEQHYSAYDYHLRLFVVGDRPLSRKAMLNLHTICEDYPVGRRYRVEVIDLAVEPHLGDEDKVRSSEVRITSGNGQLSRE